MEIDIKKLALLSRIEITGEEEEKFKKDFESILGYVSKLAEAKLPDSIGGNEMMNVRTTELENVARKDDGRANEPGACTEVLLKEAPASENGYVKVKHIFE